MALDQEEEYKVHWIDSGDYHYMTFLFCERIRTPFSLILFDHHPDDQEPAFGNVLSCGGWVAALRRENPFLRDVISVGVDGVFPSPSVCQGPFYVSLDKDVFSPAYARTDWSQGSSAPGAFPVRGRYSEWISAENCPSGTVENRRTSGSTWRRICLLPTN